MQNIVVINNTEVHFAIKDSTVHASSLEVAKVFEKRHDNIIRCIENFGKRALLNFEETVYNRKNPSGGADIPTKMYQMNRDGFAFLVMGFTGAKAEDWKLDFIEAFNKLEMIARGSADKPKSIEATIEYAKRRKIADTRQRVDPQDPLVREALYIAHGGKCFYTGATLDREYFHIDHIQPKAKGGEDALYNLVLCDPTTNRQKGDWIDHSWVVSKQRFNENTHAIIAGRVYNDRLYVHSMSSFREQLLSNAAMVQLLCKLLGERVMKRIMMSALGVSEEEVYSLSSVEQFIKDKVQLQSGAKMKLRDMYEAYAQWCKDGGVSAYYPREFEKRLKESSLLRVKRSREPKGDSYALVDYVLGGAA